MSTPTPEVMPPVDALREIQILSESANESKRLPFITLEKIETIGREAHAESERHRRLPTQRVTARPLIGPRLPPRPVRPRDS